MYQLIENKKDVKEYLIINNNLVINTGQNLLVDNEIVFSAKETYISNIKKYNQTVYIFEYKVGLTYFYIKNVKTKITKDFIKSISLFINENDIIYGYYSKDYATQYRCRINLKTNEQKWEIESYFGNGKMLDNFLYTTCINKNICKIDLNRPDSPLWQFNLEQLGNYEFAGDVLAYKVVQFIGIWQNKLLVQLSNSRIIALDVNTGKLLHNIEFNKTNPLTAQGVYYDQFIKMHLADNKIIWLNNQTLLQVDLNTFKTKTIKEYYSPPRQNQWRFMHNTYFEGKLYFTADYAWQYVTPSYVGVMDANTGEVLWSQQLKNTGGLPEAPKVTNNKLYIRTNTGILHIFEKTVNDTN